MNAAAPPDGPGMQRGRGEVGRVLRRGMFDTRTVVELHAVCGRRRKPYTGSFERRNREVPVYRRRRFLGLEIGDESEEERLSKYLVQHEDQWGFNAPDPPLPFPTSLIGGAALDTENARSK